MASLSNSCPPPLKAQNVIVFYPGEWVTNDNVTRFVSKGTLGVSVPQNSTYAGLVDIIYGAINVDRERYDLQLKVKYNVPGSEDHTPSPIEKDSEVSFFLDELAISLKHRVPLCVSLLEKSPLNNPIENQSMEDEGGPCLWLDKEVSDRDLEGLASPPPSVPTPIESIQKTMTHAMSQADVHQNSDRYFGATELANFKLPNSSRPQDDIIVGDFEIGSMFENKKDLQIKLHKYAMTNHFEFKVEKSRKTLWYVKCLEENCKWKLRAVKGKFSEMFEIRKYVDHTCSILKKLEDKRPAPSWVIGECLKRNYMDHHHDHPPKKIMEDFQQNYGIKMTYNKAWRSRKKALMAARGTVEVKVKKERTQTKRRASQGEIPKVRRRCSSCGGLGHNRASCAVIMPTPSTVRTSTSATQPSSQLSVQFLG